MAGLLLLLIQNGNVQVSISYPGQISLSLQAKNLKFQVQRAQALAASATLPASDLQSPHPAVAHHPTFL
jgi:hypothetical protein